MSSADSPTGEAERSELLRGTPQKQKIFCGRLSKIVIKYVIVLLMLASWVATFALGNFLQDGGEYQKPFFILHVNHCSLFLLLPGYIILLLFREGEEYMEPGFYARFRYFVRKAFGSPKKVLLKCPCMAIAYFIPNLVYTVALPLTSIGSANAIFQTQAVFVFIFSVIFLKERGGVLKLFSVLLALGGACVICFGDGNEASFDNTNIVGDVLMASSAMLWGAFDVFYKWFLGDIPNTDVLFLLSMFGLVQLVCMWPIFFLLNATGWEVFVLPPSETVPTLIVNAAVSIAFNLLFMLSLTVASPLFVSTATMLTVPLCFAVDALFFNKTFFPLSLAGSAMVFLGFGCLNFAYHLESRKAAVA